MNHQRDEEKQRREAKEKRAAEMAKKKLKDDSSKDQVNGALSLGRLTFEGANCTFIVDLCEYLQCDQHFWHFFSQLAANKIW